jgi:hypothetical protein
LSRRIRGAGGRAGNIVSLPIPQVKQMMSHAQGLLKVEQSQEPRHEFH